MHHNMDTNHLHYLTVEEFIEKRFDTVAFTTAPDGLPLLAYIPPPPRAVQLLATAASVLGIESTKSYPLPDTAYDETPIEPLVKELERLLKANAIHQLKIGDESSVEVLPFPKPIHSYIGETLLERLINSGRTIFTFSGLKVDTRINPVTLIPPPMMQSYTQDHDLPSPSTLEPPNNSALLVETNTNSVPQPKFNFGQIHLALPLSKPLPILVRREVSAKNFPQFSFVREFLTESIEYFREARLIANTDYMTEGVIKDKSLSVKDLPQYVKYKREMPSVTWTLKIPRTIVAQVIYEIAIETAKQHERGELHGDLKPANILITKDGVRVFDSLRLQSGERSPAMTRGWAAPEQILGKSISTQTDQYPIGLMLLEVLKGVPYGEEAIVSIPVGKMQVEKHTIFRNPGVFIDAENETVKKEAVNGWRDFIEQCIRFDSDARFESMTSLADALQRLIEQDSLLGELEMPLSFGRCVIGRGSNDNISPCWLKD